MTVNLSPVALKSVNNSTQTLTTSTQVAFGNSNGLGTITMTDGTNWADLGYKVGQGIFVGSSTHDANANGTTFNAGAANPYYTIEAINGDVLTLTTALAAPEPSATVTWRPLPSPFRTTAPRRRRRRPK